MNLTIVLFVAGTVITFVSAIFWRWVSSIKDAQQEDKKHIRDVKSTVAELKVEMYQEFQTKQDAHNDAKRIMDYLAEIKSDIRSVSDKLDNKADK